MQHLALHNNKAIRFLKPEEEMKKVCYWCGNDMGEKHLPGNITMEVFHSLCDGCADKLNLNERLPELLMDIVALRKRASVSVQSVAY